MAPTPQDVHSSRRAKSSSPPQTPKKVSKFDPLLGNPYETREYRFSRLRNAAIHLKNRTPNKPGQPDNRRDLKFSRLRELYAGYVATMEPGVTYDPRVAQLRQALIDIGHPDFVDEQPGDSGFDQTDKMSIDDHTTNNVAESNNSNVGIKQSIKHDVPIKQEGDIGNFIGCAAWEQRFWDPPYPPNYAAPIQVAPGIYQYPVNPDDKGHGAAYVKAGDGTFQPFSRDAALEEYFHHHPVEDPEVVFEAYRKKYHHNLRPFDYGDDTDDKVLMCVCLKYDDGREYIECDNTYNCMKRWFHPECLGLPKNLIPVAGETWYCPDCLGEGRLGAKPYAKMVALFAQIAVKNALGNVPQDDRHRDIKPWTADALKPSNAQNLRDLGISTLDEAKATLRDRSIRPIGQPVTPPSIRPVVINGTVVRQPNKYSWTVDEDLALVDAVKELYNEGLSGNPLWEAIEPKLKARNVDRNMGAARNRWMRGLREEYQLDERRKKNANKLTTAIQIAKADRDPNSNRAKRYTVSRKAGDPAGHVQAQNAAGVAGGSDSGYQVGDCKNDNNNEEAAIDVKGKGKGKAKAKNPSPLRNELSTAAAMSTSPSSPTPRRRRGGAAGGPAGGPRRSRPVRNDDDDDDDSSDDDVGDDDEDEDFVPARVLRKRN